MRSRKLAPCDLLRLAHPTWTSPAEELHYYFSWYIWTRANLVGRIGLALGSVVWPLSALASSIKHMRRLGARVQRTSGKSTGRQLFEQLTLAMRFGIKARQYYMFELYDEERYKRADEYLLRRQTKGGVYRLMKRVVAAPQCSQNDREASKAPTPLSDKARFHDFCVAHEVRTAPVFFAIRNGMAEAHALASPHLPSVDLFAKPANGRGGRAAQRWDCIGPQQFQSSTGQILDNEQLWRWLVRASDSEKIIVQPRLRTHSAIADLSNGALTTVRIVTCRGESGGILARHAAFRMACGENNVVDNFHAGGIAAAVDIESGRLGRASDMGLKEDSAWYDLHPQTGGRILDRVLPYWADAIRLVIRAHKASSQDRVIVGWDVALLEDGPCIVEGNGAPDLDIIQRTSLTPLGNTILGEALAFNVRSSRQTWLDHLITIELHRRNSAIKVAGISGSESQ
jgi:hypothetical protein